MVTARRTLETNLFKRENSFEQLKLKAKFDKDVGDCKSALGGCMMGANSCVCAQMSKPMDDGYDFTPIGDNGVIEISDNIAESNNNHFIDRYSEVILNFFDNKENEAVLKSADSVKESVVINTKATTSNICEGCECASTCNIKEPANYSGNNNMSAKGKSNVYTVEGVVKIKDTFDIDIPINIENAVKADNNFGKVPNDFVLFSTCRDIIGNCLVAGSEGCLCARMMVDEQQAMAQEIDDITPVPKTECYT